MRLSIYGIAIVLVFIPTMLQLVKDKWAQQLTLLLSFEVISPTFSFSRQQMTHFRGKNKGQQLTDHQGLATFNTVYPGWYRGRATHMHVKVHVDTSLTSINGVIHVKGGHVSHTGQFFFDDSLTDVIGRMQPYASNTVQRTRNNEDMIYSESNGSTMIIPVQFLTSMFADGMTGEITVGVDPTATPAAAGGPRPPGPPGPRPPPPGR